MSSLLKKILYASIIWGDSKAIFKRKKNFVTDGWTHRREGGNSGLDLAHFQNLVIV